MRSGRHSRAGIWAIDLGGTYTKFGLVTEAGEVLAQESIPTRPERGGDSWADEMAGLLHGLAASAGVSAGDIRAIGIGAPGPLSVKEGVLTNPMPNLPGWQGFPICSALTARTDKRALLDNDANVAALAEHWLGIGRGVDHLIVLTLGTGIGSGVIVEGRLLHGFSDNAGELGHISINHRGPRCACGNRGCIELYASASGLGVLVKRKLRSGHSSLRGRGSITARDVFEAAREGDAIALQALAQTGRYLGMAIASMIHAFNPELVVIAGGMAGASEYLLGPIREVVRERTFPDLQVGLRIETSSLGDTAGILGAARLALLA